MQSISVLELKAEISSFCHQKMAAYSVDPMLQALVIDAVAGDFQKNALETINAESLNKKIQMAREDEDGKQRENYSEGSD